MADFKSGQMFKEVFTNVNRVFHEITLEVRDDMIDYLKSSEFQSIFFNTQMNCRKITLEFFNLPPELRPLEYLKFVIDQKNLSKAKLLLKEFTDCEFDADYWRFKDKFWLCFDKV
mmetsp:Transcript_17120/g.15090  ORF Transcript_17120/g.15090 Transcript_17120/m.15090 type:complete len:115 (+) Transcript_17120:1392-1736(+)